ncbi:AAA family ATPase [Chondrinema litorale]|uniref:AAA family ATPase n=1 Tax=Chondrinema litorale TaxID=2994555 RepID=UPI002543DA0E|nr:AAA family ATPase [Chondrinema litorale]UZR95309.1 AAA family ATPase [Chondrinema litorale]
MHVKKLKIVKLYGYIDKVIDFNHDLTILVGINGAGKTSILNIVNWILRPSLPNLCVTDFKSLTLFFEYQKENYEINCIHYKSTFRYKLKVGSSQMHPLIVKLREHPSNIENNENLKQQVLQSYLHLGPDDKEKKTWQVISKFPKPTVVGLDRHLYAEESEQVFVEDSLKGDVIRRKQKVSISPLDRVKEIINKEYRKQKNSILNLTNSLKNHLMLSAFNGSITEESFSSGIRYKLTYQQIENAENRVHDYFENFEETIFGDSEKETVKKYFSDLKAITTEYQNNPEKDIVKLLYGLNANQFIKVRKLLREFEKFEEKVSKTTAQIQNYLQTLNYFFKDSGKEIAFKEDTFELTFNTINRKGEIEIKYKDINFLSSGEQQILILFSYIAFNNSDGKIFIIDEPELSLHIKWQEDFLEKLDTITPNNTQIILATHSPILVSKKKKKAQLLVPYN